MIVGAITSRILPPIPPVNHRCTTGGADCEFAAVDGGLDGVCGVGAVSVSPSAATSRIIPTAHPHARLGGI